MTRHCSFHVLILVATSCLLVVVSGDHLLTIGVLLDKQNNVAPASFATEYTLENRTDPEVLVRWTLVDHGNPFLLTQQFEQFADSGVDIVVLNEDIAPVVKATSSSGTLNSGIVTYQQKHSYSRSEFGSGCGGDFSPSAEGLLSAKVECNGTESVVSRVGALVAVITSLKWTEMVILYDDSHEMMTKELSDSLSAVDNKTHLLFYGVRDILNEANTASASGQDQRLFELLETLYVRRSDELRVVLLCSAACTSKVLSAASGFDARNASGKNTARNGQNTAMSMVSRWLLILPPELVTMLEHCDLQVDNVAVIIHPPITDKAIGDITKEMPNILTAAYESVMGANITADSAALSVAVRQILMQPDSCYVSSVETLLWKPDGRRLSDVGYVSPDGKLCGGSDVFPNIKFGLNRRHFVVATLPWPSFVEPDGNGSYRGLCVDLLLQLQTALNFSYEWKEPADGEWGTLNENGTWTGLVGLLQRQEVDLVVAPLSIQAEREDVMDFIHPYYLDYTTVLLKLPDPDESKWRRLIQPFKPHVHMCIWISLLGVTLITFLLEAFNPFYATNPRSMLHIGDMFWYMYGALLTQGGARLPDSQTGRTMVSAFWLFSIVMAAIYSGNLIAFMTVIKEEAPFETLRGMVNQDDYTWGTAGGTAWVNIFQNSNETQHSFSMDSQTIRLQQFQNTKNDVFKKIWAGINSNRLSDPNVLANDPKVHLEKVKAGGYAYIGDKSAITTWLLSECDLIAIKEEFLPMHYSIGLINNSAYTPMFSDEMLKINEIGLTETWTRKWWQKTSFCKGSLIKEPQPVYLVDVQSAFYLVFIGITLALIVLGLERVCSRFQVGPKLTRFFQRRKKARGRGETASRRGTGSVRGGQKRIEIHNRGERNGGVHFYGERRTRMNPLFHDEGGGEGRGGRNGDGCFHDFNKGSSLWTNGRHQTLHSDSAYTNTAYVCDEPDENVLESIFTYDTPRKAVRFYAGTSPSSADLKFESDSGVSRRNGASHTQENGNLSRRRERNGAATVR